MIPLTALVLLSHAPIAVANPCPLISDELIAIVAVVPTLVVLYLNLPVPGSEVTVNDVSKLNRIPADSPCIPLEPADPEEPELPLDPSPLSPVL